jgi:predicted transposase/invertase (TIGR01784 family)
VLPEEITKKYIILDIMATDESGQSYEIEMQVRRYESYPKRALYYLSRIYAGQLEAGEDYEKLKPVIGIHFLDYEIFFDNEDFRFRFEMRDVRHPGLRLTDDMSLHIFELPKFERIMKTGQMKDALGEWLHFFNHAHEEDKTMRTAYKNPAIHRAFDILETLSADETVRHLARVREDALRNERSELFYAEKKGLEQGLEKGRKEGEHEKAVKTAENLLSMGVLTIEQIAQATGLSIKEIQKLQRKKK